MNNEILHKYAEDSKGNIIYINQAIEADEYFCPDCKGKFVARKGKIRQHHFSHLNLSPNCTGEGYLHKTFKSLLTARLRASLTQNVAEPISWQCQVCNQAHTYDNLLKGIEEIRDEYSLPQCRPDIALIGPNKKVPVVIEIIHTHEPEANTLRFYIENQIILIRIKVEIIDDIERLEEKLRQPSSVAYFSNLLCPNLRMQQQRQQQLMMQQRAQQLHNLQLMQQFNRQPRRLSADELMERSMRRKNRGKKRF